MLLLAAGLLFPIGLWAAAKVEKATGAHDLGFIVIDEVVGQWITLAAAALMPVAIVLAFILFRIFDIIKPWPVSWLDKQIGGAWGVMLDDVAAGILGALCLLALQHFIFPVFLQTN